MLLREILGVYSVAHFIVLHSPQHEPFCHPNMLLHFKGIKRWGEGRWGILVGYILRII